MNTTTVYKKSDNTEVQIRKIIHILLVLCSFGLNHSLFSLSFFFSLSLRFLCYETFKRVNFRNLVIVQCVCTIFCTCTSVPPHIHVFSFIFWFVVMMETKIATETSYRCASMILASRFAFLNNDRQNLLLPWYAVIAARLQISNQDESFRWQVPRFPSEEKAVRVSSSG